MSGGVCRAMLVVLLAADTNLSWNTKWLNNRLYLVEAILPNVEALCPVSQPRGACGSPRAVSDNSERLLSHFFVAIYVEQRSGSDYIHRGAGSRVARTPVCWAQIYSRGWEGGGVGQAEFLALIYCCCSSPSCLAGRVLQSTDRSLC